MAQFSAVSIPNLRTLGLSEAERALIVDLQTNGFKDRGDLELSEAYYLGVQVLQNLRIAIPKELEFIAPTLGWAASAVDPYVERLYADGFRLPSATDSDVELGELLEEAGFGALQSFAFEDALSQSRALWCVGSPAESGAAPVVTVESPKNMAVKWDLMGTTPRAAWMEYRDEQNESRAVLMAPRVTVHLGVNDKGEWEIADRDEHGFDFVPVARMAHQPRTQNRNGRSAISPALRYLIQAACRTLLGLEVSREFYSVPQKVILGATEADFQKSDGSTKTAWETYVSSVLALERDETGALPELKQLQAYDPSVFTKVLDWLASSASGLLAATPQDLGLYTQGNPATAEAVQAGEARRDRRARRMQRQFGPDLVRVAQMVARFADGGTLRDEYRRLTVDWSPVTEPNPAVTSDALSKEIAAGMVPPTSDVVLRRAGYSLAERQRLEQDRRLDRGLSTTQALIDAMSKRAGSVDNGQ